MKRDFRPTDPPWHYDGKTDTLYVSPWVLFLLGVALGILLGVIVR